MKTEAEMTEIIFNISKCVLMQLEELDLTIIESSVIAANVFGMMMQSIGDTFPEDGKEEFGKIILQLTSSVISRVLTRVVKNNNFMNQQMEKTYETLKNKNNATIH